MQNELRIEFLSSLDFLEKHVKLNLNQLGMEPFANTIYYFCKF